MTDWSGPIGEVVVEDGAGEHRADVHLEDLGADVAAELGEVLRCFAEGGASTAHELGCRRKATVLLEALGGTTGSGGADHE